jgi:tyrosyl-tRNA synthetase
MTVFEDFRWRGLVHTATEGTEALLRTEKVTAYIGFDPSAASLHVGSLLPLMALARLQRHGHSPIAVAGGGTGLIGDPSGKTLERQLLSREQVEHNLAGIRAQIERFLDFGAATNPARIINNADWLSTVTLMDFLRDVGKHFTVNAMVAKESVKRRLAQEDGISFTEFSYMLLQAYDFLMLYDRTGCKLQLGGSDQWGNIVAGVDLIRKLRGDRDSSRQGVANPERAAPMAYGLVLPLVTTSSGVKFGKTEAGAVWLDGTLTSPYRFYQFWLNTDDRDVLSYLQYFTWMAAEDIEPLAVATTARPEERAAQKRLAAEVTRLVHGETALAQAERASRLMFGGSLAEATPDEVAEVFAEVPSSELLAALPADGAELAGVLVDCGLVTSRGEARRLIAGGGLSINNERADEKRRLRAEDAIGGRFVLLRKGRRDYHLLRLRAGD